MAISERNIIPVVVRRTSERVVRRRVDLDVGRRPAWGSRLLVANVTFVLSVASFHLLGVYVWDLPSPKAKKLGKVREA